MIELTGWGRFPRHLSELAEAPTSEMSRMALARHRGIVPRGNGRAYGDAAVGEQITLTMRQLDRMRSFDPSTGYLTVEAGVLLSDVLATFAPRGFFPPVVPGTKHVTIGGMIAADVHGKSHHKDGGFGNHVEQFKLALPGGELVTCSRTENPDLFAASVGGMGLVGAILEATFQLRPIETAWIKQQTVVAENLDAAIDVLDASNQTTYSVAWIDCLARGASLGRSLIYLGEHATKRDLDALGPRLARFAPPSSRRLTVPMDIPALAAGGLCMRAFNELYFRIGSSRGDAPFLVHWDPYFFPLDGIGAWNRLYGRRGFLQHQSVIPLATARTALANILSRIARSGNPSFLAVLKRLGPSFGTIAFPMEGYTLALDLPVSPEMFPLLDEVDRLVVAAGGRLYLAKDARQSRATFEAGYPGLDRFHDIRRAIAAEGHIVSRLSLRLGL